MKWLKGYCKYNESNEEFISKFREICRDDLTFVESIFNMLFQPLGWESVIDTDVTIRLTLNFANKKSNLSLPIIHAIDVRTKYLIKYVYPILLHEESDNRIETITFLFLEPGKRPEAHSKSNNNMIYEYVKPNSTEEIMRIILQRILKAFKYVSTEVTQANDIDMPKPMDAAMFRDTIVKYCNYLLSMSNIVGLKSVPEELYNIFYTELGKYQGVYNVLSKIKDTPLYNKFKEIGDTDEFSTATKMGDIGF